MARRGSLGKFRPARWHLLRACSSPAQSKARPESTRRTRSTAGYHRRADRPVGVFAGRLGSVSRWMGEDRLRPIRRITLARGRRSARRRVGRRLGQNMAFHGCACDARPNRYRPITSSTRGRGNLDDRRSRPACPSRSSSVGARTTISDMPTPGRHANSPVAELIQAFEIPPGDSERSESAVVPLEFHPVEHGRRDRRAETDRALTNMRIVPPQYVIVRRPTGPDCSAGSVGSGPSDSSSARTLSPATSPHCPAISRAKPGSRSASSLSLGVIPNSFVFLPGD